MPSVTPVTPEALVDRLTSLIVVVAARAQPGAGVVRVALDGAPATRPDELADRLVGSVRALGHPVLRVRAADFLRPASIRFEHGRHDPDAYLDLWLDAAALEREVLVPLGPHGTGRYLPSLWDAARDRATRAQYLQAPPGAVLLVDGTMLLGRWLSFDLSVHLALRPASLERMTAEDERWTLPAFARYTEEVEPEQSADAVVRVDDPRRPALMVRG